VDIQRIRNLTTGKLHTKMSDIYEDLEYLIGEKGIYTHQIPAAYIALLPFLKSRLKTTQRLWDDKYDPTHLGTIALEPLNSEEQVEFWKAYSS
jgi:hypothetical protein